MTTLKSQLQEIEKEIRSYIHLKKQNYLSRNKGGIEACQIKIKELETKRDQLLKDMKIVEEAIIKFAHVENLKLSWSDIPVECPVCKLDNRCWSKVSENPRKEICIYCRIRELKQELFGEEK